VDGSSTGTSRRHYPSAVEASLLGLFREADHHA
jgi:hypothetical protein